MPGSWRQKGHETMTTTTAAKSYTVRRYFNGEYSTDASNHRTLAAALDAWTPCADVPAFAVEAGGRHWGFVLTPPPGGDDAADRGVNVRARGAA